MKNIPLTTKILIIYFSLCSSSSTQKKNYPAESLSACLAPRSKIIWLCVHVIAWSHQRAAQYREHQQQQISDKLSLVVSSIAHSQHPEKPNFRIFDVHTNFFSIFQGFWKLLSFESWSFFLKKNIFFLIWENLNCQKLLWTNHSSRHTRHVSCFVINFVIGSG